MEGLLQENCGAQDTKTLTCIKILRAYKKLSENPSNHHQLLKDKTVMLLIGNLLDTKNMTGLELCLDILINLIDANSETNGQALLHVFGLYEGICYLSMKQGLTAGITEKVKHIESRLVFSMIQPGLKKIVPISRKYNVYNLYLSDLTKDVKQNYESILLNIEGIVSFVIDLDSSSCMIRTRYPHKIQTIIKMIRGLSGATPLLITFNAYGKKEYIDATDTSNDDLEYNDQKSFVDAPVTFFKKTITQTKNRVKGFLDVWNQNFYW